MDDIAHVAPGPLMSQATVFNGIAWLSGQIGAGGPHDSFEDECRATLAAADRLLARVGSHRGALLHVTVHVRDLRLIARFNPVWTAWLAGAMPPARVAFETPMVDPAYSVAVSCIARTDAARPGPKADPVP